MKSHITLPSGRKVILVDTGCDLHPKIHFPWLSQISPKFFAVPGGRECQCHEYAADAVGMKGRDGQEVSALINECLEDCDGDEEKAFQCATEGMLSLSGGAEWLDVDDWGVWTPSPEEHRLIREALLALRNAEE